MTSAMMCAAIMGDDENETRFREYAQSYRNVFDPEHGLMRGRRDDGSWEPNFSPTEWSEAFCEAASIQYSYMVPHDVEGLMALMGGKEAFVKSIEKMLAMDPVFEVGQFPCEVHEMSEMAAVDFGQYAHCNQPSHHILFLFALAGRPDLTNYWVHRVLKELYRPEPDGLPGDAVVVPKRVGPTHSRPLNAVPFGIWGPMTAAVLMSNS